MNRTARTTLAIVCAHALLGFAVAACGATGQSAVTYPMLGAGQAPTLSVGQWQVTLTSAQVGVGPIYFCATTGASSDLCPSAVEEYADTAVIDATSAAPQPLGNVTGISGEIRSATMDYGITWFTTQQAATPTPHAPGGHSAHFEGSATKGPQTVAFSVDVDVATQIAGERSVQGLPAVASVKDPLPAGFHLLVGLSPQSWFGAVDYDALAATATAGKVVTLTPDSRAYNALVIAMTASFPPTFSWSAP